MKRIYILAVAALTMMPTLSTAQNSDNCIGFIVTPKATVESSLSERNQTLIISKTEQILARNSASNIFLYNQFGMSPEIIITEEQISDAGMMKTFAMYGEFTLTAVNITDMSSYATTTVKINGYGNSKDEAMNKMINNIKVTEPTFTKFIKNATQKISDYYTKNMKVVLGKVETLIAQEKYDDALNLLCAIPECVPSYEQSAAAIISLSEILASKSCDAAIVLADRYLLVGDTETAKEFLMSVKPESSCNEKAREMLSKIGSSKQK